MSSCGRSGWATCSRGAGAARARATRCPDGACCWRPPALAELVAAPLGYDVLDVRGVRNVPAVPAGRGGRVRHGGEPPRPRARRATRALARTAPRPAGGVRRRRATTARPGARTSTRSARWCRLLEQHGIAADPGDLSLPPPAVAPARAGARRDARASRRRVGLAALAGAPLGGASWRPSARAGRRVAITGGPDEVGARPAAGRDRRRSRRRRPRRPDDGRSSWPPPSRRPTGWSAATPASRTSRRRWARRRSCSSAPPRPARWGPPRDRSIHRALWAGRTGDPHASEPDPGLLAIAPQMVIDGCWRER